MEQGRRMLNKEQKPKKKITSKELNKKKKIITRT